LTANQKRSTIKKDEIIEAGAGLFLENGFFNTGINEILKKARIPKGSFYFYFSSKEEFGLKVIEKNKENALSAFKNILSTDDSAITKINNLIDLLINVTGKNGFRTGCSLGSMSYETSGLIESFREQFDDFFVSSEALIKDALKEAQNKGELKKKYCPDELASFFVTSIQGAMLRTKTERNSGNLEICRKFLISFFKK